MKKRRKKEWFDDDSFWIEMYPYLFTEARFKDAIDQIDQVLKLVKPKGKSVLDLCCGPGRCSIPLANKGYKVTGVDRTEFLLKKAKARARKTKTKIEWIQQDMRDFIRPEGFDLVLSMFTSFGYFDRKQEDMDVLNNIFSSLKPGGSFVIDVAGKEQIAKTLQPTTSEELPDGAVLVERHEVFDEWTRIRNEWIIIQRDKSKRFKFHLTIYSGQELRDRLELVGFHNVKLYSDLSGKKYGPDTQRLIAVGLKPTV